MQGTPANQHSRHHSISHVEAKRARTNKRDIPRLHLVYFCPEDSNNCRRQRIHHELYSGLLWEQSYGFMKGGYIKNPDFQRPEAVKNGQEHDTRLSGLPSKLPPGIAVPGELVHDLLNCRSKNIKSILTAKKPHEKYTHPCTANQDIGWEWVKSNQVNHLERFGRVARGKKDIMKIICGQYEEQR